MEVKLVLNSIEYKDLTSYCNLNDLLISDVVKKSFIKGFNIERYGLLGVNQIDNKTETIVEKIVEVIKEVPVEKVVEVIKEVPVEKIVEVVKEVEVEKIVEVVKEIPVEKVVEIIKEVHTPPTEVKVVEYVDREVFIEVPVEKILTKVVNICDNSEMDEMVEKTQKLEIDNELLLSKIKDLDKQLEISSIKKTEIENNLQNEKNNLLNKIMDLESRSPEVVEIVKEVPTEVIKEVFVEKMVVDDTKQKMLEQTLQNLRSDMITKDKKIKELEDIITSFQKQQQNVGAAYLRGSNLDSTMFK